MTVSQAFIREAEALLRLFRREAQQPEHLGLQGRIVRIEPPPISVPLGNRQALWPVAVNSAPQFGR